MDTFYYKGVSFQGDVVEGFFDCNDKSDVADMLKKKGYIPVRIEKRKNKSLVDSLRLLTSRIGYKDFAVFCRQFAIMLEAGIPVIECLSIISQQTPNPVFKKTLEKMVYDLKRGLTLAEAFKNESNIFPEILISMVEAGEVSGRLDEVLKKLSVYFENLSKQREKIKNSLTYPIVLSIVAFFVVVFLMNSVIPTFVSLFSEAKAELPFTTRVLLLISQKFNTILIIILLFVILVIALYYKLMENPQIAYKMDYYKLNLPIIGRFIRKGLTANFASTLAILIASGIPILKSLEVVERVIQNRVFEKDLEKAREDLRKGKSLYEALERSELPMMLKKMIGVGEEAGALEDMLSRTAGFFENEMEFERERLLSLIEPIMIVSLALIVGFIVVAIVMPIFTIYSFY
ncbi:MAG: type II secretion system F family protein [Thermovenabulum sp.]|uniref:type II secretion system F family protein n=1 Tax=Thermovenabulum sp. TaxID=3100335 RepID=UPI003C7D2B0E